MTLLADSNRSSALWLGSVYSTEDPITLPLGLLLCLIEKVYISNTRQTVWWDHALPTPSDAVYEQIILSPIGVSTSWSPISLDYPFPTYRDTVKLPTRLIQVSPLFIQN